MQNGRVNGTVHHDEPLNTKPYTSAHNLESSVPETPTGPATRDSIPSEPKDDEVTSSDSHRGPPSKKRKVAEPRRSLSRAPSPPWKKAGVDGPTSYIQDGRRKSSRVNISTPNEMQPPSDRKHAREIQKSLTNKNGTRGLRTGAPSPSQSELGGRSRGGKTSANGSRRTVSTARGIGSRGKRVSQSPIPKQAYSRTRSRSSGLHGPLSESVNGSSPNAGRPRQSPLTANLAVSSTDDYERELGDGEQDQDEGQRVPRLRIKIKKPSLDIHHPAHVLPPRRYGSFREWLESEDGRFRDDGIFTPAEAAREAEKRRRVEEAAEPGGLLSEEVCSAYLPEQQEEPPQQYSHQDHLVSHALYFKKLLDQEHRRHRHVAKLFAQWCADAWRKRNKDPEDVLREQQEEMRGKRKQLAKDLQKMFDLARAEVDRMRLARWEEERKVEDQQALDRAIKQSTMLFEKRRQEILGETGSDMPESSEGEDVETDYSSVEAGEDEGNMSSDLESEDGADGADDDEGLTAEELRLKYANLPEARASVESTASSDHSDTSQIDQVNGNFGLATDLDEVDPVLLDDSDASTDMDDDMGDSEGGEESSDTGSEEDDGGPGLLGFFASKDVGLIDRVIEGDDNVDGDDHAMVHDDEDEDEDEEEPDDDEVFLVPNNAPAEPEAIFQDVIPPDTHTEDEPPPPTIGSAQEPESEQTFKLESATVLESEADEESPTTFTADDTPLEADQTGSDLPSEMELDHDHRPDLEPEARRPSAEPSSQASPDTPVTKPDDPESVSSYDAPPTTDKEDDAGRPAQATDNDESLAPGIMKTPLPHLIRGTLREYQHFGLDWLAGLYSNHINGILADEMGLGKTIQTIALLAHLAIENEIWGPHLVVVPTSVILNWEMEFKKWCPGFKIMTYYGNQEERRQKRRGWMDDTSWNVLITSYQLVLQDQQVLKRRSWHYMILDEAHNIKNFRSQRWQALLTFRTRARLLLTGTPLQNNLTELWSLLFFLMPSDGDDTGIEGFADLRNFSEWFRRPVEQILEHGRETMDDEAKRVVTKLHTVLRPYILRRLKADVEKQMPGKYEHVVYCRLSKRQRFLYDGFMSRAQTKETLASGNYLSIINCLMQLRKVCNHPDLFETRQISTSFAMPKSVATEYGIKDFLVRRRLLFEHPLDKLDLDFLNLVPISREHISRRLADDSTRLMAYGQFNTLRERQYNRTNWQMEFNGSTTLSTLESLENDCRKIRMAELERCLYFESKRHGRRPVYGSSLIEFLTADSGDRPTSSNGPLRKQSLADWLSNRSSVLASMVLSIEERSQAMEGYVQRFACVTPAAVAAGITEAALTPIESRALTKAEKLPPYDPFHEAQMRLSIAFPDKRLLQYDCGKLQRLDKLLRDLKAGGHRALIFTQMTKMLDILEQFLNIHGHRYLRLDGTTKVEQRQVLTDRFNNDNRILAFILSSRSGGLGINLTGADTVIFYDLDWNPAMDKQCQDRCHRIGQTRDVHIYRFVSEYTIESNILRKANQKRMLDDVVIQEGEFNTDYMTKLDARDMFGHDDGLERHEDEATAAMDRVLETRVGGSGGPSTRGFEQVEDKEDIDAAKNAQKELENADQDDFEDGGGSVPGRRTRPGSPLAVAGSDHPNGAQLFTAPDEEAEEWQPGDIDEYLIRFMEWNKKDEPLVLPVDKSKKRSKKGKEHRLKRRR